MEGYAIGGTGGTEEEIIYLCDVQNNQECPYKKAKKAKRKCQWFEPIEERKEERND